MTEQEIASRLVKWSGSPEIVRNRRDMMTLLHTGNPAPDVFASFYRLSDMSQGESEIVLVALADNLSALRRKKVAGN
jgi:hypothetical protein